MPCWRLGLETARAELAENASAAVVDTEQSDSLRRFFGQTGPITDLVVTITRRGGAGPVSDLADAYLPGAESWSGVPVEGSRPGP